MGAGEAATDAKAIDGAVKRPPYVTGQQPLARKSIATCRQAAPPAPALRGDRMWSSDQA